MTKFVFIFIYMFYFCVDATPKKAIISLHLDQPDTLILLPQLDLSDIESYSQGLLKMKTAGRVFIGQKEYILDPVAMVSLKDTKKSFSASNISVIVYRLRSVSLGKIAVRLRIDLQTNDVKIMDTHSVGKVVEVY
jgi:hypothetical protein